LDATYTFLIATASFLCGGFLTAVGFISSFTVKFGVMQKTLDSLDTAFKAHIASTPTCAGHQQVVLDVDRLKEQR